MATYYKWVGGGSASESAMLLTQCGSNIDVFRSCVCVLALVLVRLGEAGVAHGR